MHIVLVTNESAAGRYVAAELHAARAVDRVVIETRAAPLGFYLSKLRRVGVVNFAFQAWFNRWFRRETAAHLPDRPLPPHERVVDANQYAFADDALVIGFGTSYIRQATLARVPLGFLNLHTGWLPDYRGVKSEFWAVDDGDVERIGWTVHFMTPELDGGDIVLQSRVGWDGENPAVLRARLIRDAVPAIATVLRRVKHEGTNALTRTPQRAGRYRTTPTFADWRRHRRRDAAQRAAGMAPS